MEYFQIPKFHARSDFFNKKDKGRFQKLVKAIEEIGIHKKCGIVIVNPPETVKNNARRFVSEKLETKGLTISSPQSQKPTKISFVFSNCKCFIIFIMSN